MVVRDTLCIGVSLCLRRIDSILTCIGEIVRDVWCLSEETLVEKVALDS